MTDLSPFELFVEVVDHGGITPAAKHLGVSKAALSKQIKQLQQHYGITLFVKSKQRLQITPEGERLLAQCRRLKREMEDARTICRGLHDEPQGKLHVVAFPYFAEHWVFPKLREFLQRYPKIDMQIDTTEKIPNFYQDQIDISMGYSLPVSEPDDIIQRRMATARYQIVASPDYFARHGKPERIEDLYQHQYIEHTGRMANRSLKLITPAPMILTPSLWVNTVSSMLACARQGLGLVQLPEYVLERDIRVGSLVEVLSEMQLHDAGVYFHYPKLGNMQPKVRRFIEFFIESHLNS